MHHTALWTQRGVVFTFGEGAFGQLGNGAIDDQKSLEPAQPEPEPTPKAVEALL